METRINYLLVGIFVLVLGFAFLASITWLTLRPATQDYNTYLVYTTYSVSGLSPEAPVKYNGVDVGRVARLRLDPENPDQVKILLEIRPNTPVRQNTLATIEMQGLTGIAYLNLTSPSQDAPLLKPSRQEPYPEIQSGPSLLTRMDEGITALLTSLTQTSDSVHEFISGPNKVAINKSLGRLEELLNSLSGQTESMGETFKAAAYILEQGAAASDNIPELLESLGQAGTALEQMANEVRQQSVDIGSATTTSSQGIAQFMEEGGHQVRILATDLQRLIQRLENLTATLADHPESLLVGRPQSPPGPGEHPQKGE